MIGVIRMKQSKIVISEADLRKLRGLIESNRRLGHRDTEHIESLEHELDRALVRSGRPPKAIVALGSWVRLKDLDHGRELHYQIVLPKDANADENRISVLAPIGTGLLGYGVGTVVEWAVPSGIRRFRILAVQQQAQPVAVAA